MKGITKVISVLFLKGTDTAFKCARISGGKKTKQKTVVFSYNMVLQMVTCSTVRLPAA